VIGPFYGDGYGSPFVPPRQSANPLKALPEMREIRINYVIDKFVSVSDAATNSM
jgi:hypothetical protein